MSVKKVKHTGQNIGCICVIRVTNNKLTCIAPALIKSNICWKDKTMYMRQTVKQTKEDREVQPVNYHFGRLALIIVYVCVCMQIDTWVYVKTSAD